MTRKHTYSNVISKNVRHIQLATMFRGAAFLFVASLFLLLSPSTVSAVSQGQMDIWNSKNVYMFDLDVDCNTSSSGDAPASDASSRERLQYIYTWFRGRGLTAIQAAAAVGNIAVESGGIPTRKQGKGIQTSNDPTSTGSLGWGLIQWSPGSKILKRAEQAGVTTPIYEMDTQLNIIYWLMTNTSEVGVKNMLKDFTSTTLGSPANGYKDGAVYYFEDTMEGAGSPAYDARYNAAKIALQDYENASSNALTTSTPTTDTTNVSTLAASGLADAGCSPTGTSLVGKGLAATAAAYVWPYEWGWNGDTRGGSPNKASDGTSSPYDMMPEYKKAIEKANSTYFNSKGQTSSSRNGDYTNKLYTGAENSGIDCGGFVTRLVQDSGLDPQYNMVDSKGRVYNGYTEVQKEYLRSSGRWTELERGQPSSYYKPGDVAIQTGHTLIYVGEISTFWPVKSGTTQLVNPSQKNSGVKTQSVLMASASQKENGKGRSPMADRFVKPGQGDYKWYRYNGSQAAL